MKIFSYTLLIIIISCIFINCSDYIDGGEIDWYTNAREYYDQVGLKIKFKLSPNEEGFSGAVWGTDKYTYDSAIGPAAVHAGVINLRDGGEVVIEILEGLDAYMGSNRNNITTSDWGPYDYCYRFIK